MFGSAAGGGGAKNGRPATARATPLLFSARNETAAVVVKVNLCLCCDASSSTITLHQAAATHLSTQLANGHGETFVLVAVVVPLWELIISPTLGVISGGNLYLHP